MYKSLSASVVVTAAISAVLVGAQNDTSDLATNSSGYPVVEIPAFARLEDLPLTRQWNKGSNVLNLDLRPATLELEVDGELVFRANMPIYVNLDGDANGGVLPLGPLLSLKRGEEYAVTVQNSLPSPDLSLPGVNETLQKGIDVTNFHVHGIHEWGGVPEQTFAATEPSKYLGGDNVLLQLRSGETLTWTGRLSDDHLPGNHWYHPHKHQATAYHTIAAHGPILVEDDLDAWLKDDNGCADIRAALGTMPTRNVFMTTYNFQQTTPPAGTTEWYDANYQQVSLAGGSTICCDTDGNSPNAFFGNGADNQLVIVNGGWQPVIDMKDGQWQRWRLWLGGDAGSVLLSIVEAGTQQVAEDCELMLLSKDGVYPQQIPRAVGYGFIPSGARAEVLVRCSGDPGKAFDLVSRDSTEAIRQTIGADLPSRSIPQIVPQKIASIVLENSGGSGRDGAFVNKQCTPLRPAYAADLRNENLLEHNAVGALTADLVPNFDRDPNGCMIGGMPFAFPDPAPFLLRIGSVTQWPNMGGLLAHPLHVHINPFMISDLPELLQDGTYAGHWFEVGDYHDTLLIPQGTSKTQLRFQAGPYSGYSVTHCHFLNHEDAGCMRVIEWRCPDGYDVSERGECGAKMPVPGTFNG